MLPGMADQKVTYRKHRDLAVGDIPDADPRVTAPADRDLFQVQEVIAGQGNSNRDVAGHALVVRCLEADLVTEVVGATVDFTTWIKDEGSGKFVGMVPVLAAVSSRNFTIHANGPLFVQINAIAAPGLTAFVQVWLTERASVV